MTYAPTLSEPGNAVVRWYPDLFTPSEERPYREVQLTRMQRCVLESLCEGKSNLLIKDDWGIEEDTVKSHVKALLRITGARDRTHLVAMAYSLELQITLKRPPLWARPRGTGAGRG